MFLVKIAKNVAWWFLERVTTLPLAVAYCLCTENRGGVFKRNKIRILAMESARFRKELEAFDTGCYQIIKPKNAIHAVICNHFYTKTNFDDIGDRNRRDPEEYERIQKFLTGFLGWVYKFLSVDCVLSPQAFYFYMQDWGEATRKVGVPFVVIHRENLFTSPHLVEYITKKIRTKDMHFISRIVVQNELMRNLISKYSNLNDDRISIMTPYRIDALIAFTSKDHERRPCKSKTIALFSFSPSAGMLPEGWGAFHKVLGESLVEFYELTHRSLIKLALDNPQYRLIIKCKWGGEWLKEVKAMVAAEARGRSSSNIEIVADCPAQEVITQSDIVIGYGSTTLLESMLMGKHVIMPVYGELKKPEFKQYILFQDDLDKFNIAASPEELCNKIINLFSLDQLPEINRQQALLLARKHLGPLQGDTTQRLDRLIHEALKDATRQQVVKKAS